MRAAGASWRWCWRWRRAPRASPYATTRGSRTRIPGFCWPSASSLRSRAIVWELGPVKDLSGPPKAGHIALVAATILSAWAFIHVMFAIHYAGAYYAPDDSGGTRGGLKFPGEGDPGWGDFLYQAFVIGCACATADVNTTSPGMRVTCLVQGVVAFFFNTIILALTINIGAGFI